MAEGSSPCFESTVENGSVPKTCAEVSNTCGRGAGDTVEAPAADTRESSGCEPHIVHGYDNKQGAGGAKETLGASLEQEEELLQSLSRVTASEAGAAKDELSTSKLVAASTEKGPEVGDHQQCVAEGREEVVSLEDFKTASIISPQRSHSSRSFTFGKSQKKNRPLTSSKSKPPSPPKYRGSVLRRKHKDEDSGHLKVCRALSQQYQSQRPEGLPPKSKKEAKQHKKEVERLLKKVEKRELEAERKEFEAERKKWKKDEKVSDLVQFWKEEVLPNWESRHKKKEVKNTWELGLPPSVRGQVWSRAIGNALNLSRKTYEESLAKCEVQLKDKDVDYHSNSVQVIQLDIMRTFPTLGFFQKGCVMYQELHDVLGAYACYRPDVGYVQGMSFLAAVLLLNMDQCDAFTCLANLLSKPCYNVFFRIDQKQMQFYFDAYNVFFREEVKAVYGHFEKLRLLPHYYLLEWIITLYTKCLPLDTACRMWDLFCRDGESFLFRTALGILKLYKHELLQFEVMEDCGRFLSKFPDDVPAEKLVRSTMSVNLTEKEFDQQLERARDKVTGSSQFYS